MKVLWLRPSTGEHVSLRRERIAAHLSEMGVDVTIRDASGADALGAIKAGLTGDYDVILGNVRIGLYLGYPLARLRRLPFIGDVSDSLADIEQLPGPLFELCRRYEWWVLERSDACFVVESRTYEETTRRGIDPTYVRNAVDYSAFAYPDGDIISETRTILENRDVDMDSPVAMYIGSMVPEYYLTEIVEAASMTPEWEFVFLGQERGVTLSELAADHENVHYLGAFEYDLVPGFLSHASCALCLVDKEQPLKVMEYGAAGLPTLGYDGKLRANFTEDELLFLDPEPDAISRKLSWICEQPDEASAYGEHLQRKAKDHSWNAVAQTYYDQLERLA
ncbi:glycosyltransferase [Halovenus salina]|uniref:Glycosyltransferase n=1 Tax=Halovenus salina TaxID=1510225 RepID=A0ABD5W4U8_9EURY|nr:glycosyltransferase [Halovenus salina]